MKKLSKNLAAKIVAWILLIFFSLILSATVASCLIMVGTNAYWDGGWRLKNIVLEDLYKFDSECIYYYTAAVLSNDGQKIKNYGYKETYSKENSNIYFVVTDKDGNIIIDNGSDDPYQMKFEYTDSVLLYEERESISQMFDTYKDAMNYYSDMSAKYDIVSHGIEQIGEVGDEFGNELDVKYEVTISYSRREQKEVSVKAYLRENLVAKDRYYYCMKTLDFMINARYALIAVGVITAILCIMLVVFLCVGAGRVAGVDGVKLMLVDKIPYDIYLGISALIIFLGIELIAESKNFVIFAVAFPICLIIFFSCIVTLSARAKAPKWYRNTLIYFVFKMLKKLCSFIWRGIKYVCRNLPLCWKAFIVFLIVSIVELIFLSANMSTYGLFWMIEKFILALALIYTVVSLRKLQRAAGEMAKGDLSYRVDTSNMIWSLKKHGEDLNAICDGMSDAVQKQMKSEHMKAELITNVSHDIKTPLTSIINYTALLKKEGVNSENANDYLDVIERQANRLKKLTEDVIEASKASTGCITVNAENTDVNVLLSQAVGEYEDKLEEKGLEVVMNFSEEAPVIYADGSLTWRVFDNLFNNICKYSQEGTRVYLKTDVVGEDVVITFSNISKNSLNISSEELMERFVRGDASRNTEGSGLGLSIAQSLIELQGGKFVLKIDGDLFKTEIIFKLNK